MGTFFVTMEIGDPQGDRFESIEALVDTGATYTSLPTSLLQRLGIEPREKLTFIQADGTEFERDIGQTWARVDGKSVITIVIFAEEDAPPLLGAYTLEGVRLAADPVDRRLVPVPGYLVSFWPHEPRP
jgi:clan AA aspartic protease